MYTNNMNKLFAEGGMNDDGGTVDPVSGNEVPPGAMKNEVRDDIDAKLSEGEFVIPADVVRYIGLERLMKLRDEAKQGLSRMSEIGQMGNADQVENPEALHEGDDGFESEIDDIISEVDSEQMGEKKFGVGGFAEAGTDLLSKYNIPKTSITNPALDVRAYKNAEGRVMYITFFNGKPSIQIPAGYDFSGSAGQFIEETKKEEPAKTSSTAATPEAGGDGPTGPEGGASVGTGSGVGGISGTSIGNSSIGIAIGSIANSIEGLLGISNPNTPVSAISMDANNDAASNDAAAAAASAASAAATAASESPGDTSSNATTSTSTGESIGAGQGEDGDGVGDGVSNGDGVGDGNGGNMAKGGFVFKRGNKTTQAVKKGIA
jgi:hypothetical protein